MNVAHWLKDTITVSASGGSLNEYGEKTSGAQTTIKCRFENQYKLLRNSDGEELASNHVFVTDTEIHWDDLIWIPGEDTSNNGRKPLDIKRADTLGSYNLWEVRI